MRQLITLLSPYRCTGSTGANSGNVGISDVWLANCYFADDSLEFPALLPFWDAPSGRSFHSVRTNF